MQQKAGAPLVAHRDYRHSLDLDITRPHIRNIIDSAPVKTQLPTTTKIENNKVPDKESLTCRFAYTVHRSSVQTGRVRLWRFPAPHGVVTQGTTQ